MGGTRSRGIDSELSRHQRERDHGGVVLSVLGQPQVLAADFARWANARHGAVIPVKASSFDAAARAVVASLPRRAFQNAAHQALAAASGRSMEEVVAALVARSPGERMRWLATLSANVPRMLAAGWILSGASDGVLDAAEAPLGIEQLVPALAALADWFAVLVVPASVAASSLLLATAIAAKLAEQMKPHAVALTAPRLHLDRLFAAGHRGSVSLARQGLIEVPAAGAAELPRGGRSKAERILYAALESESRTRGRFSLSYKLPFSFNGQPAEVDLFDAQLAFAVEIDGWHHFQDPVHYRRDRDKDLLLQRAGVLVLRVLEDDVWERLDYVVDQVANALNERHRTAAGLHTVHTS